MAQEDVLYIVHRGSNQDIPDLIHHRIKAKIIDHQVKRGSFLLLDAMGQFGYLKSFNHFHIFIDALKIHDLNCDKLRHISKNHRSDRCLWVALSADPQTSPNLQALKSDFHIRVPVPVSKGVKRPKIWGLSSEKDKPDTQVYLTKQL